MHGDEYDEALTRFHRTGPEFDGWLSNHGPMATDALVRLGDWLAFFDRALAEAPWRDVLTTWFPRLMPGAVASATHCLIRTGHAVRALRERETPARVAELGQALGYWSARWLPLPTTSPRPDPSVARALTAVPQVPDHGGARTRLAALTADPGWAAAVERVAGVGDAGAVPTALLDVVDTAVTRYAAWAEADPTMLVHMATAPRAALLVLPSLPSVLWPTVLDRAWATSAAIAGMYRPAGDDEPRDGEPRDVTGTPSPDDVVAAAVATADEHAITFAEVAVESHTRGNPVALVAASTAARLLG